jgi:sigma-B regulation protein RsbU (phosphoserine phosphatase)
MSTPPIAILLLEDSLFDAQLIEARLRKQGERFVVQHARDGARFAQALLERRPDVILSDYEVPGFDGLAALEAARERWPEVPFLFVSGALGEERAIELLKRGATDYVLKDNLDRLIPCVERALAEVREREERTRAEQALRRSEARSRALIAALAEGIALQDPQGCFLEVNAAALALLGCTREQLEQHAELCLPGVVLSEEGTPCSPEQQPMAVALRTGHSQVGRVLGLQRPGGAIVWLSVNSQPVFDSNEGGPAGVVSSFFDITERKQHAELEQQLIGIVSHDLRSPLSTISYVARALALRGDEDERVARAAHRIQTSVDRAVRLVSDLLDFTQVRLGSGIPLSLASTDLHEITRNTLAELQTGSSERKLVCESHGDGSGRWDADRLAQVIQNLVINALTYSPVGSTVHVHTRGEPDAALLEVHNLGTPIPSELLPSIFNAMQRGDGRGQPRSRSVGLGLFIVYHIVSGHGGTVSVHSSADEGTTFSVRLPRDPVARPEAHAQGTDSLNPSPLSGLTTTPASSMSMGLP